MNRAARRRCAPEGARKLRNSPYSAVTLGAILVGCTASSATYVTDGLFEQNEIVIGAAKRQTVLTGFLLAGARAELALLHIDEQKARRLRIYSFDGRTWSAKLEASLRPDVLFVDVASIGGRDRLLTYAPGRLSWFDPDSSTERELLAVTANFNPPRAVEVPHVDITHDVNGDERDDLVVPDMDGFWVFIQMEGGAFADPVKIGPTPEMDRIYGSDGYRYDPWSQSRIHSLDYDGDGRGDLAFWSEDHFKVHLQSEQGLLDRVAKTFTTALAFDSDQLSALATGDMQARVMHSLDDLNGDGIADLAVISLQGSRLARKRSTYEVHFGSRVSDGRTEFAPAVGTVVQSIGKLQLALARHDFDRDGQVDMMFTTIELGALESGMLNRFAGFMGGEVHIELECFRMDGGSYAKKPGSVRRVNLQHPGSHKGPGWVPMDTALRGGKHVRRKTQRGYRRAFQRPVFIGDVTGDGRLDLIIGWHRDELSGMQAHPDDLFRVYVGMPGPALFASRPKDVAIPMPLVGDHAWLVDLNKDGKQDMVVHYPSRTGPQRVTVLMAR